jgi:hypothetical protein
MKTNYSTMQLTVFGKLMQYTLIVSAIALVLECSFRILGIFSKESKQFFYRLYMAALGLMTICCCYAGVSQLLNGGEIDMRVVMYFIVIGVSLLLTVILFTKNKQQ